ncbi:MAG: GNAT family N-acetyltransferase [Chloroflexi bacterium]|nr:GNAT family N-acetyltransferase [Chloroflexota bacterium]
MALVTSEETFKQLWDEWEALLSRCPGQRVFQTPVWHHLWWREMHGDAQLQLTSFREDGALVGLAPLMSKNRSLSFLGDTDLWDYHDFVVAPGKDKDFFPVLFNVIDPQPWKEFTLTSVPETSLSLAYLPDLCKAHGYTFEQTSEDVAPGLALPPTWDDYLSLLSKKDRHELRRKLRRLEGQADFKWYAAQSTPADSDAFNKDLSDFFGLMALSRAEKAEFLTPDREAFFRRMALDTAKAGVLRLFFMEVEGKRVAAAICFDYGNTRFLYNSGYNPDYYHLSVGLLLNAMSLRQAIEEGKGYFDFLRGNEPYKYDLGAKDVNLYRLVIRR